MQISDWRKAVLKTSIGPLEGLGWEKYCQSLLRLRYRDEYQEVPAQFGGDFGIEGFTRTGITFQCYCPNEDQSGIELYKKQRDKITTDIKKLIKNASVISSLGAGTIREWHFLTPYFNNNQLISHCRTKETFVRRQVLDTIDNDFSIYIKTEDDYIPERQMYIGMGGNRVQPALNEPDPRILKKFIESDNEIVGNIKLKLEKIKIASDHRARLTRQLVSGYIVGQGELETLNEKFPSTYRSVLQIKAAKESQLEIQALSNPDNNGSILPAILQAYRDLLSSDLSGSLSCALIERLSTEAISDWLGRCPLDFPLQEEP